LLTRDHPGHSTLLTDKNLCRLNVTLNVPIDLQRASTDDPEPLPNDFQVVAYDRLLSA
jgi:hypothetical protein